MRADVGSMAGKSFAEIWNRFASRDSRTVWGELEISGFRFRIETGVFHVDGLGFDPVMFLCRRNATIAEVVIKIVVDIRFVVARAPIPRAAHMQDVVS